MALHVDGVNNNNRNIVKVQRRHFKKAEHSDCIAHHHHHHHKCSFLWPLRKAWLQEVAQKACKRWLCIDAILLKLVSSGPAHATNDIHIPTRIKHKPRSDDWCCLCDLFKGLLSSNQKRGSAVPPFSLSQTRVWMEKPRAKIHLRRETGCYIINLHPY